MEDRGEFPRRLLWTEMPSSGGISSHAGEKDRAADTAARAWVIDTVLSGALSCLTHTLDPFGVVGFPGGRCFVLEKKENQESVRESRGSARMPDTVNVKKVLVPTTLLCLLEELYLRYPLTALLFLALTRCET